MKRIGALTLCAALMMGMLSGCDGGEEPYVPTGNALYEEGETEPTEAPVTEEQVSMPYYADRSLNPYECTDYVNKSLLPLLYQGLFATDSEYQSWPILCDSYQVSWDMKTYTFTLAQATFSDGTPVTPEDVEASLKAAGNGTVYKGRFRQVEHIQVTEEGKLELQLKVPCENLPLLLDVPIVKAAEVEAAMPLGTGPYVFVPGTQARLQRRTNWWCDGQVPVTAERIQLTAAGTPAQLRDAFEFSNLSMVTTDPGSDSYADFHSDYELWESENGIFLYLGINQNSEVLSQPDIRRGLLRAVDRESIVSEIYRGFATAASLPASPDFPGYNASLASQYDYDRSKLIQAVASNRDVAAAALTLLVNSDDGLRVRVAHRLAQDLTGYGLNVRVSEKAGEEYTKALNKGEFDVYLGQTRLSPNMDLTAFFEERGSLSVGGLEDPTVYSLCLDALANIGNYHNLHQKIMDKGMICPILFRSYAIFTQRGSFRGLNPARDNLFFYHLDKTMEDALITE